MRTFKFEHIHVEHKGMTADVDFARFEKQYTKAQYKLDTTVMTHMIPYMPKVTGLFINVTKAMSDACAGSGMVVAAAPPYGRYLYYGKTMVSPSTGSAYAAFGEKKVLVSEFQGKTSAKEDLDYNKSANPDAQAEWFEAAKQAHGKNWVAMAKKIAGGG